jgi:hypothetical protein
MTMAPLDPHAPEWKDLARQWQELGQGWLGWWQQAASTTGLPAPAAAPPLAPPNSQAITELSALFQPRFRALAQAMFQIPAAGGKLPELVASAADDRRFKAPAWREQPYFAFLKQAYLLYAEYMQELAKRHHCPNTKSAASSSRPGSI